MDVYSEEVTLDAEMASEEDTLDAEKASKEDTPDAVSKVGEETKMPELWDDWTEDDSTDEDSTSLKRDQGDGSEGTTGQQRTVYTWRQVTT